MPQCRHLQQGLLRIFLTLRKIGNLEIRPELEVQLSHLPTNALISSINSLHVVFQSLLEYLLLRESHSNFDETECQMKNQLNVFVPFSCAVHQNDQFTSLFVLYLYIRNGCQVTGTLTEQQGDKVGEILSSATDIQQVHNKQQFLALRDILSFRKYLLRLHFCMGFLLSYVASSYKVCHLAY